MPNTTRFPVTAPRFAVPAGACDCHIHIIGPADRYPFATGRSYTPMDALLDDWRHVRDAMGIERTVIVQPSIYGTDNRCTLDALKALGGSARAVVVVDIHSTDMARLKALHAAGARGLRVNIGSGGPLAQGNVGERLRQSAELVAELGWHVQIFAEPATIRSVAEILPELPTPVVIDHFGLVRAAQGPDHPDARMIADLLATGRIWVKISASYRIGGPGDEAAFADLARAYAKVRPDRLVWGSDWPHTPAHQGKAVSDDAPQPYRGLDTGALLDQLGDWFADAETRKRILVDNPAALYGF